MLINLHGLSQLNLGLFLRKGNYSPEIYEEVLRKLSFPNYELFDNINTAYENFIQKVIAVIDNLAPSKNKSIKGTSKNCFDAEIMEK